MTVAPRLVPMRQNMPEKQTATLTKADGDSESKAVRPMKFTHFFIARPIFAIVLSLLMLLAGAIAFLKLPLSEYPAVTPPTVQVSASYPGANPQVIADTVAGAAGTGDQRR